MIFKVFGLGELKPTSVSLPMADSSVKELVGIIRNVEVTIASFIYPVNLIILNCEVDTQSPIILCRPFLSTGRVLIHIDLEGITFKQNNK